MTISERIAQIRDEIETYPVPTLAVLELFRMRFVSRKSVIMDLYQVPGWQSFGKELADLRELAQEKYAELAQELNAN